MNERKKKILIIGCSGFIGKNFKEYILNNRSEEYEIIVPSSNELDCTNEEDVSRWLANDYYDVVCHFGYYTDFNHSGKKHDKILEYNLRSFQLFEKYNHSYGRMFYAGSGAEYDKRRDIVDVEETCFGEYIPADVYGLLKYTIGKQIEASRNIYNLRIFGLFGKYEYYPTKFISGICAKSVVGLPLSIRQNVIFNYLWIDDFCRMLLLLIEANELKYHTYNMVSGNKYSLVELCEMVNDISDTKQVVFVCKEGLAKEYSASNKRFLEEFPDFSYTDMKEAIVQLYDWYKDNAEQIDLQALIYG